MQAEWQNRGARRFALGPETWSDLGALLESGDTQGIARLFELPPPGTTSNGREVEYVFFTEAGPERVSEKKLVNRYKDFEKALSRIGSHAAFTTALDLEHSPREAIVKELAARCEYAEGVLSGEVLA